MALLSSPRPIADRFVWIPLTLSLPVMSVLGTLAPSLSALITLMVTEHRWPKEAYHQHTPMAFDDAVMPSADLSEFCRAACSRAGEKPIDVALECPLVPVRVQSLTLIGGPLREEPGWRGFALPRLERMMAPWKASLLLGTLWACWHLPLFLSQSWSSSSIPRYILIVLGLSCVMTFLFNLSGLSLIVAILAHAMFNAVPRWLAALLANEPLHASFNPELVIGLCGICIASILIAATRGKLAQPQKNR